MRRVPDDVALLLLAGGGAAAVWGLVSVVGFFTSEAAPRGPGWLVVATFVSACVFLCLAAASCAVRFAAAARRIVRALRADQVLDAPNTPNRAMAGLDLAFGISTVAVCVIAVPTVLFGVSIAHGLANGGTPVDFVLALTPVAIVFAVATLATWRAARKLLQTQRP